MDVWRRDFDNKKERLEQIMSKVDPNIEWIKEIRAECTRYLKLMTEYDMPVVQMDPEKVKPYFQKKMEDVMSSEITVEFMSFYAHAFDQSELFRDQGTKYDEDWKKIEDNAKEWSYRMLRYKIIEVEKLQPIILKFMEYTALKKKEDNPIDNEELPKE